MKKFVIAASDGPPKYSQKNE